MSIQGELYRVKGVLLDPKVLYPSPFHTPASTITAVVGEGLMEDGVRAALEKIDGPLQRCTIELSEDKVFAVFWTPIGHHRNSYAFHHLDISFHGRAFVIPMSGHQPGSFRNISSEDASALWVVQREEILTLRDVLVLTCNQDIFLTQVAAHYVSTNTLPAADTTYYDKNDDFCRIQNIDPEVDEVWDNTFMTFRDLD